jgi:methionyl-tRNA formyltransferase
MKFAVFAYNNIGCRCLELLVRRGEDVRAVFTHTDDPNENIYFDSVEEIARASGLPCHTPKDINARENVKLLRGIAPDVIFSFYYRQLLSNEILDIPPDGAINLHGSLLPKYRGRAPLNWAIINGEKETGVTLHYMVERPDAGDIIAQRSVPIRIDDTAIAVAGRMTEEAVKLLDETLPLIAARQVTAVPQDESQATTFPRRTPEDGCIDWDMSNLLVYDLIRALTHPFPGAFSYFRGKKLFIWGADMHIGLDFKEDLKSGTLVIHKKRLMVNTGSGLLMPLKLQVEEGPEMPAEDFIKKYGVVTGERLSSRRNA